MYFITIVTKDRNPYFGSIEQGSMKTSKIGKIARYEWFNTSKLRPDMNISLYDFVLLPDHMHAVIRIGKNRYNSELDARKNIHTPTHNLPSIIRGYKSAVTSKAQASSLSFAWQRNYFEHIIRSFDEYYEISRYIRFNVRNWKAK